MMIKEKYFDSLIKDDPENRILKNILKFRDMHELKMKKGNICFLILDMQKFFFDKNSHAFIPQGESIIKHIKMISDIFFEFSMPVIMTRHINTKENAEQMGKWWRDFIRKEDEYSELIDSELSEKAVVIEKTQYNAFYNTNLESILKAKNVTQVLIGGVMTHLCCETTAREAFVRGYDTFFGIDFTATYNRDFHLSSLLNISHGFAYPVFANEVIERFG